MVGKTKAVWIAVLMLAGANGLVLLGARTKELALRLELAGLPGEIEGWAEGPVFQGGEVRDFGGDDVLSRGYARPTGYRKVLVAPFNLQQGILDEIQRRPELFAVLRVLVDRPRAPRFLVQHSMSARTASHHHRVTSA